MRLSGLMVHREWSMASPASCDLASLPGLVRFQRLARRFDLIHFHFPWPLADVLAELLPKGLPYVVTYHSDIVRQQRALAVYRPLMKRFLGRAARVVATSPNYRASSPVLRDYVPNAAVIPLGLEEERYPAVEPERVAQWRRRLGEGFFLFVGVLRYYKGLEFLVEAARLSGLPVVVVGQGPLAVALQNQGQGIQNLHFLGYVEDADKVALYQLAAAVCFPSHLRSEAFGVTLLEGAMYAKPLISAEIGTGTSFVNIHGETGLVVPPADPGSLAQAMTTLARDPALRNRLGAGARSRFQRLFTARQVGEQYASLYNEVVGRIVAPRGL
jgi:rhamnosyl/mannosyltransferase